jgi:hypothetical protein
MNKDLIKIHGSCISKNLPFVTFRLPQQEFTTTYIQTTPGNVQWNSILDICGETGFIMAPFDTRNGHRYILVKPDLVFDTPDITRETVKRVESLESRPEPPLEWSFSRSHRQGDLYGAGRGHQILHRQGCFPEGGTLANQRGQGRSCGYCPPACSRPYAEGIPMPLFTFLKAMSIFGWGPHQNPC